MADKKKLENLATNIVELRKAKEGQAAETTEPLYRVEGGRIERKLIGPGGAYYQALGNFAARITGELVRDDGVEQSIMLQIEGALATGRALPAVEVPAAQFCGMSWIVSGWGSAAVVSAGASNKDHLRAAIQVLSDGVSRRVVYSHTGWRKLDGSWVYLHAGGAIGQDGDVGSVEVALPDPLVGFSLPSPPDAEGTKAAAAASLSLLDLAQDPVTVPVWLSVWRAVLGEADFSLHLTGQTQAGKSELAALVQQHFGETLGSRRLPGSWSSTGNALEGLAFAAKDAVLVCDDFAPSGDRGDNARYHATAERLLRAQGNRSGRVRMRADATLKHSKPPRGMILSTGEDTPRGQSIRARCLILELGPKDLRWDLVTIAQRAAAAGEMAACLSAFVRWLAPRLEDVQRKFKAQVERLRPAIQASHKRTADTSAQMLAAGGVWLSFAVEASVLSEEEAGGLFVRLQEALVQVAAEQEAHQTAQDPVERFAALLAGVLRSGRGHLTDSETGQAPADPARWGWVPEEVTALGFKDTVHKPKGHRVGWVPESYEVDGVYLDPEAAFSAVQEFARTQGEFLPVQQKTLWKRLSDRGALLEDEKKNTHRRTVEGRRLRVINITPTYLEKVLGSPIPKKWGQWGQCDQPPAPQGFDAAKFQETGGQDLATTWPQNAGGD